MIQSAAYEIIKEEGRKEGLYETISMGLELKFGEEGLKLMPKVLEIKSFEKLNQIKDAIRTVNDLDNIKKMLK